MKKILTALLFSAIVLTGCGSTESSGESGSSAAETSTAAPAESASESPVAFRLGESPDGELILTGEHITDATASMMYTDDGTIYSVLVKMDVVGADAFAAATQNALEEPVKISVWYGGELLSSPAANAPIMDGNLYISGDFTLEEAKELADKLCPAQEGNEEEI